MTYRSCTVVFIALVLGAGPALAWQNWYRYENDSFVVYSDASTRQVRNAVEHLELFRAAVTQVANIAVPADAPKVTLVIVDSHARFHRIIGSQYLSGATFDIDGIPHIVAASGAKTRRMEESLRHAYAHILLAYKNYPYPPWFDEGFAELVTQTTFRNRNTTFSLGEPSGRRIWDKSMRPWEEILGPDLDFHSFEFVRDRSDAHLQSWLLTHYFMLGNDFGNAGQLQQYLDLLAAGHDSVEAMETVLGEPLEVWARRLVRKHANEFQKYYTVELKVPPSYSRLSEREEIPANEVEPILERIRDTCQ